MLWINVYRWGREIVRNPFPLVWGKTTLASVCVYVHDRWFLNVVFWRPYPAWCVTITPSHQNQIQRSSWHYNLRVLCVRCLAYAWVNWGAYENSARVKIARVKMARVKIVHAEILHTVMYLVHQPCFFKLCFKRMWASITHSLLPF